MNEQAVPINVHSGVVRLRPRQLQGVGAAGGLGIHLLNAHLRKELDQVGHAHVLQLEERGVFSRGQRHGVPMNIIRANRGDKHVAAVRRKLPLEISYHVEI